MNLHPEPDYKALIETAGDIIYALDLQGRFTYFNPAASKVLGYTPKEANDRFLGQSFISLLTPDSRHIATQHFLRGLQGNAESPYFDVEALRKDGTTVILEVRATSLYRDGELVGRQGIARDITEIKRLQGEVAAKSERISILEERMRIAYDLYARISQLAFDAAAPGIAAAPDVLSKVQQALASSAADKLGLTTLDLKIIGLLSKGLSNRETAQQVHLSVHTVKDHIAKIMQVTGTKRRAQIVSEALRHGLISTAEVRNP